MRRVNIRRTKKHVATSESVTQQAQRASARTCKSCVRPSMARASLTGGRSDATQAKVSKASSTSPSRYRHSAGRAEQEAVGRVNRVHRRAGARQRMVEKMHPPGASAHLPAVERPQGHRRGPHPRGPPRRTAKKTMDRVTAQKTSQLPPVNIAVPHGRCLGARQGDLLHHVRQQGQANGIHCGGADVRGRPEQNGIVILFAAAASNGEGEGSHV